MNSKKLTNYLYGHFQTNKAFEKYSLPLANHLQIRLFPSQPYLLHIWTGVSLTMKNTVVGGKKKLQVTNLCLNMSKVNQTSGLTCPLKNMALKKSKLQVDSTTAGKIFTLQISSLRIYVPSWCLCVSNGEELLPYAHSLRSTSHWCFFAYHITSTISVARHRSR